jgi:hypothetical protein
MPEENLVSAYHNYLVEGRLRMGLTVGDPGGEGFFFVAHPVRFGEPMPVVSARLFGRDGGFILEMQRNSLVQNPDGIALLETSGGWALVDGLLQTLFSVEVRAFDNCYMTVIRGTLFDPSGRAVLQGDDEGLHILEE